LAKTSWPKQSPIAAVHPQIRSIKRECEKGKTKGTKKYNIKAFMSCLKQARSFRIALEFENVAVFDTEFRN